MRTIVIIATIAVAYFAKIFVNSCSTTAFGSDAYTLVTDPTFSMTVNPPVPWTYAPQENTGNVSVILTANNFFPGQSPSAPVAIAVESANIQSAVLAALKVNGISSAQVTVIVPTYTPRQVSACYLQAQPMAVLLGEVQAGALIGTGTFITTAPLESNPIVPGTFLPPGTQALGFNGSCLCTAGAATILPPSCVVYNPYSETDTFFIKGLTLPKYVWDQIANDILAYLTVNYGVIFLSPITYS